ncbi:MAG: glycosyltransferase [Clostridia bacterium]|nr:glycosyltransferase [Clostridia bacterium]
MKNKKTLFSILILAVSILSALFLRQHFLKQQTYSKPQGNETPKVSIIIPVYNVEKYIKECINSAVNQTLKDIEIICVDDGSTDSSGSIIDEYANKDPRVHVVHKQNSGVSATRNKGIDLAKGEYIKFIDSDDVLDLTACEVCYNKAKSEDADIVVHDSIDKIYNEGQFSLISLPAFVDGVVWTSLYRTSFIKENNIRFHEETSYGEDQAFNLLCNPKANKIVCISNNFYMYRTSNDTSLCHDSKIDKHSKSHATNVNYVYDNWKKNGYFDNNTAKINFLKWFCDMNYWKDNYEIDKMFLNSIGKELLDEKVLNLLPKEYKTLMKNMIKTAKFKI